MNQPMKKLALIAAAAGAAALAPSSASAQFYGGHPGYGAGGYGRGFGHGFGGGNFFGGFAFGGFFHQPQFHVQNWQLYGFIQPQAHQRWVRYYDDAYLVDRRGYIFDHRARVEWDRYGEKWARDQRGIPYYVGRGDYHPDGRDYEYVDAERRWGGNWDYSGYGSTCGRPQPCGASYDQRGHDRYERRDYSHDARTGYDRRYAPPPPPVATACGTHYACGTSSGAYGYSGYGSGYGCGSGCGTVIVTETTVTPGEVVEVYEEVVETHYVTQPPARHHKPAARPPVRYRHAPPPVRRAPPPPPIHPDGERG